MLTRSLTNLPFSMPGKTVSPIPTRYILDVIAEPVGLVFCTVCKSLCSSNSLLHLRKAHKALELRKRQDEVEIGAQHPLGWWSQPVWMG